MDDPQRFVAGNVEARQKALCALTDTVTGLMSVMLDMPEFSDMRTMANQLSSMVMSGMAMSGQMNDPEVQAIFRNRSLSAVQRFFRIGQEWLKAMLSEPAFHAMLGSAIDDNLKEVHRELDFYFLTVPHVSNEPSG